MRRITKFFAVFGLASLLFVISSQASAAVFNPNTAAQFQADLTTAQNNGEDDTINLAGGTTYSTVDNANNPFTYIASGTENNSLTILGAGDGTTILDGNATTNIMAINTLTPADDSSANIEINGVVFQLGSSPLIVQTNMAEVQLENLQVQLNQNQFAVQTNAGIVNVTDCLFEENISFQAAFLNNMGTINFNNNIYRDNQITALAFQVNTANINANANEVINNLAPSTGVFIVQSATGPTVLTNNLVVDNNILGGFGATIFINVQDTDITLTNNTIVNNFATNGIGGVGASLDADSASISFFNNIIYGNFAQSGTPSVDDIGINDDGDANNTGSAVLLANNDFTDFFSQCENTGGCTPDVTQTANIDEDPLFTNPASWDFTLGAGSLCIQAGDPNADELPATDFAGNPLNNPPDMGAFASQFLLGIDPANIDFGPISTEVDNPQTVTLTNEDGISIEITDISVDDSTNFSIGQGTCGAVPFTIAGGDSCTIIVTFSPNSSGNFTATVTITTNDPNNPTRTISLTGSGVSTGGGCSLGAGIPAGSFFMIWLIPAILFFRSLIRRS